MFFKAFYYATVIFAFTCFDVRTAKADFGFVCVYDQDYHSLSQSNFGVRDFSKELKDKVTNCLSPKFHLTGNITSYDHKAFLEFKRHYPKSMYLRQLYLNSAGGDLEAAINIGRLVHKLGLQVLVETTPHQTTPTVCYSSCVLVLAGGKMRFVWPSTGTEPSNIGIHRPYLSRVTTDLTSSKASDQLSSLRAILRSAFRDFNVSPDLADRMMAVPPDKIKFLTGDDLAYWGLNEDDPVHQTRHNNGMAVAYGLSLKEYINRRQLANTYCRNNPEVDYSKCVANVDATGDPSRSDPRFYELEEEALEPCRHLSPLSSNDPSMDYEKAMELREKWMRCRGKYFIDNR